MRFSIIGAGAIGGYYGGKLHTAGEIVDFLYHSEYEFVKSHGVKVKSYQGDFHFYPSAYNSPVEMPKSDVVIITLKSVNSHLFNDLLPMLLTDSTYLLILQNGLGNEERAAEFFDKKRIIAGSAFICCERTAPGEIEHTAEGELRLGWFSNTDRDVSVLQEIASRFSSAGVKCFVHNNGNEIKWMKLIWNVAFNGLSVYYGGITTSDILDDNDKLQFAINLMEEVIKSAAANNIILDRKLIEKNIAVTKGMGPYKTSMTVDFIKGREIESEAIIAEPLRRGLSKGLKLPYLTELLRGVKARIDSR